MVTILLACCGAALGWYLTRDKPGVDSQKLVFVLAGAVGAVLGAWLLKAFLSVLGLVALLIGGVVGAIAALGLTNRLLDRREN